MKLPNQLFSLSFRYVEGKIWRKQTEVHTPPNTWQNYARESQNKVMEAPGTQAWKLST